MISEDFKRSFIEYLVGMLDLRPSIYISTTGIETDMRYIEQSNTVKAPISIGVELIKHIRSKGFFVTELYKDNLYCVSIAA